MEDSLTLQELDLLIQAIRQDKKETNVFLASLQGIDMDKYYNNSIEEKRKEIERRVAEKLRGVAAVEREEFAGFGIEFETDE